MSQVSSGGKWTAAFETRLLKITKMSVLSLHLFGRWRFKRVDGPIGVEVEAWLLITVRNTCVCMIYHAAAAFHARRLADTFLEIGSSSLWSIHYLDLVWPLLSPLLLGISKNDKIHMSRWLFKFFHVPPSHEALRWRRVTCWMAWGDWGEIDLRPWIAPAARFASPPAQAAILPGQRQTNHFLIRPKNLGGCKAGDRFF